MNPKTGLVRFDCVTYCRRPYVCRIYAGINPDGPHPGCGFGLESRS